MSGVSVGKDCSSSLRTMPEYPRTNSAQPCASPRAQSSTILKTVRMATEQFTTQETGRFHCRRLSLQAAKKMHKCAEKLDLQRCAPLCPLWRLQIGRASCRE